MLTYYQKRVIKMKTIFSTFLFIASLTYTQIGLGLNFFSDGRPGAGFLPLIVGILLVLFTGVTLYQSIKESYLTKKSSKASASQNNEYAKDVIFLIVLIALSVLFLKLLGGLLVMILFVFAILFFFNRGKHLQNILTSLVVPILIFLLFEWLNAGIPEGLLGLF
jgi:putative tricarboxylic transport membrane protein